MQLKLQPKLEAGDRNLEQAACSWRWHMPNRQPSCYANTHTHTYTERNGGHGYELYIRNCTLKMSNGSGRNTEEWGVGSEGFVASGRLIPAERCLFLWQNKVGMACVAATTVSAPVEKSYWHNNKLIKIIKTLWRPIDFACSFGYTQWPLKLNSFKAPG